MEGVFFPPTLQTGRCGADSYWDTDERWVTDEAETSGAFALDPGRNC